MLLSQTDPSIHTFFLYNLVKKNLAGIDLKSISDFTQTFAFRLMLHAGRAFACPTVPNRGDNDLQSIKRVSTAEPSLKTSIAAHHLESQQGNSKEVCMNERQTSTYPHCSFREDPRAGSRLKSPFSNSDDFRIKESPVERPVDRGP